MASHLFRGGVHPKDEKGWTAHKPIVSMPPPDYVVIPLSQHLGLPAEPVVQKGETVQEGQVIGEAARGISARVHASISGRVSEIAFRPTPLGTSVLSVVITRDPEAASVSYPEDPAWGDEPPDRLKQRIAEAGVVGLGGAAFPTHIKLSPPPEKSIDTLIINGVECEPYLTADHRLMVEHIEEILGGIQILQKILNVKQTIIGIESNKPDAIRAFRQKTMGSETLTIQSLPVKYPQGGEKQLIKAITGREVPSGGLPMDVGCLVHNVGTVFAVYEAVRFKKPLIERVVTVTGPAVRNPQNVRVRIGTPLQALIAFCGGETENAAKWIHGGPMMGIAQSTSEVPVIKGTSGILLLDEKKARLAPEKPCISCARCVDVCPMRLLPNRLATLVEYGKDEVARSEGLFDCIECGSCAYICPARRRLVQYIKLGKLRLFAQAKKTA